MSSKRQWRRFNFFEKEIVSNTSHLAQREITAFVSGGGLLFAGDAFGFVSILDRSFHEIVRFRANYQRVTHLKYISTRDILVTLGDGIDPRSMEEQRETTETAARAVREAEELGLGVQREDPKRPDIPPCAVAKFWDIADIEQLSGDTPHPTTAIKVFAKYAQQPINCMDILDDLSCAAFGLAGGDVILFRGGLLRHRNVRQSILRSTAPSNSPESVTFVGFSVSTEYSVSGGKKCISLFSVTDQNVSVRTIKDSGSDFPIKSLDSRGAPLGCSIIARNKTSNLVVAHKDEAVYFYTNDFIAQCYVFDYPKRKLHCTFSL